MHNGEDTLLYIRERMHFYTQWRDALLYITERMHFYT